MSEKTYDYAKICESVYEADSKIRFAGVINEQGRLIAGGMRKDVKPLENEEDDETIFMELALRVKMRKEFDRQLGTVNFAMASRKRALVISVIIEDDILYVVSEPDTDYGILPKKILKIIQS